MGENAKTLPKDTRISRKRLMKNRKKFLACLKKAECIVAEHKAQYKGIYYMKGGESQRKQAATNEDLAAQALSRYNAAAPGSAEQAAALSDYNRYAAAAQYHSNKPETSLTGEIFNNPITKVVTDIGLSLIPGGAPFIPIANAAETKLGGGSNKDALISGGEAFAGQEIIGALANQFPETAQSIFGPNVDTSGNILTGNPSLTGPGTIGGSLSNIGNSIENAANSVFSSTPTPTTEPGLGSPTLAAGQATGAPTSSTLFPGAPTGLPAPTSTTSLAGTGPGAAASAAPNIAGDVDITSQAGLVTGRSPNVSFGTALSSDTLPGGNASGPPNVGTPLTSAASQISANQGADASMVEGTNPGTQGNANLGGSVFNPSPSLQTAANSSGNSGVGTNVADTTAVAGGGPSAPSGGGGGDNSSGSFLGNLGKQIVSNPMADLSALGLIAGAAKQELGPPLKGTNQIKAIAGQENAQGQQLASYLQSGTLPPGLQAGIDQNLRAAQAQIRSRYASMGMSGSSAEQQDLANAASNAQAMAAQYAMQLLTTGINETGMAAGLYQDILKNTIAQDQELGNAFGAFAGALSGNTAQRQPTTSG